MTGTRPGVPEYYNNTRISKYQEVPGTRYLDLGLNTAQYTIRILIYRGFAWSCVDIMRNIPFLAQMVNYLAKLSDLRGGGFETCLVPQITLSTLWTQLWAWPLAGFTTIAVPEMLIWYIQVLQPELQPLPAVIILLVLPPLPAVIILLVLLPLPAVIILLVLPPLPAVIILLVLPPLDQSA